MLGGHYAVDGSDWPYHCASTCGGKWQAPLPLDRRSRARDATRCAAKPLCLMWLAFCGHVDDWGRACCRRYWRCRARGWRRAASARRASWRRWTPLRRAASRAPAGCARCSTTSGAATSTGCTIPASRIRPAWPHGGRQRVRGLQGFGAEVGQALAWPAAAGRLGRVQPRRAFAMLVSRHGVSRPRYCDGFVLVGTHPSRVATHVRGRC